MTLTIDIKDSVADKILYFLNHFKDDVKILNTVDNSTETLEIEEIKENELDYKYILDAREARKNGEKTHSLDDIMKEFK